MNDSIHVELIRLAIHLLDSQDGVAIDTFDYLKSCLVKEDGSDIKELLENVTIHQDRAFLNEDWVEDNFSRFEK